MHRPLQMALAHFTGNSVRVRVTGSGARRTRGSRNLTPGHSRMAAAHSVMACERLSSMSTHVSEIRHRQPARLRAAERSVRERSFALGSVGRRECDCWLEMNRQQASQQSRSAWAFCCCLELGNLSAAAVL